LQTGLEMQLKQAQQDMARLQDQLPSTSSSDPIHNGQNEHQGEVIASITQELRTPMTSIAGYTDLLLGESVGILGAMQRQFLQRVKANVARMEGMLTDLVQITVIDTGQLKLAAAPLDVPELIKDAVMAVSTLFREREQSIRLELADNLPKLHTDREGLQQILQHLFSNAALCSPNQAEVIVRAQVPIKAAASRWKIASARFIACTAPIIRWWKGWAKPASGYPLPKRWSKRRADAFGSTVTWA
jgi:signal transduction histidine kinase